MPATYRYSTSPWNTRHKMRWQKPAETHQLEKPAQTARGTSFFQFLLCPVLSSHLLEAFRVDTYQHNFSLLSAIELLRCRCKIVLCLTWPEASNGIRDIATRYTGLYYILISAENNKILTGKPPQFTASLAKILTFEGILSPFSKAKSRHFLILSASTIPRHLLSYSLFATNIAFMELHQKGYEVCIDDNKD